MSDTFSALRARVENKTATVGIIGLGYVGLPLARAFATAGFRVLGFDIDTPKVEKLNAGKSFIKQIPTRPSRPCARRGSRPPTGSRGSTSRTRS
jgi:UDP-N-acetyl-D-glucosamine dehydrogenase